MIPTFFSDNQISVIIVLCLFKEMGGIMQTCPCNVVSLAAHFYVVKTLTY